MSSKMCVTHGGFAWTPRGSGGRPSPHLLAPATPKPLLKGPRSHPHCPSWSGPCICGTLAPGWDGGSPSPGPRLNQWHLWQRGETPWGPHTPQVRPAWLEEPAGGRPRSHLLCPHGSLEHQEEAGGGEQEAGFGGGRRSCPGAALGGPAAPPRAERAGGSGLAVGSTPALAACAPRGHRQIPPRPPLQLPPTFRFGALTVGGGPAPTSRHQGSRVVGTRRKQSALAGALGSPWGIEGPSTPSSPALREAWAQGENRGPACRQGADLLGAPSGTRVCAHAHTCTRTRRPGGTPALGCMPSRHL